MGYYILKDKVVAEPEQSVSSWLFQLKLKGLIAIIYDVYIFCVQSGKRRHWNQKQEVFSDYSG